ncbi:MULTISPECIES: D-arabinitol 4-dehydrogenase [Providencia]|uniref:D-arabinitol dehydrogenase n=1 Tax=Providencia stuartii (strain MRSN 2154) TaxID=1157951 RepID=A0A140NLZ5_PROSM|nr:MULTISPECIES: D-arabinitol 4-dehydrogenase [Providencia]AFH94499.1 D-arabinitol dehydrogenase [Providencia stuartii MRSN 2154]MCR4081864.1 mannitol dehydrogenase family protein [Providencia stuartii]MDE8745836.1 mannitol dehydrogenase family protein [Providencia thailandensis]MDE8767246.1 mannitol dehydrogenase family protein [Providencia thailandensis]MDE8779647.1 mannitol dehydrogenase family protein [Providencia thailandensis]
MLKQKSVWMHIGAGSFHRAHQAWYLHRLCQQGDDSWSIALGNIRNDANALLDNLTKQNGEYTLETVSPEGERYYEKITSVRKVLHWDENLSQLVEQGCDKATRVIAFTVTEAGYYLTPQHELDAEQPDIKADLTGKMSSIYGALTQILRARLAAHGEPVTLLNCDNLRHNGERFRHGFLSFLQLKGETELYQWVKENTRSPNTMVDRITPRPTPDVAERVKQHTGWDDKAPVMGEAFIQWVIEDDFINGRPALENVDVEMVESVLPWEEAKIRILNASHSCIAWAGTLIGLSFIDESTRQSAIKQMAWNYVTQDVIPSLSPSPLDLEQYRDVVLARFSNPYIQDTNQRVAADGLSKIPGFITPTLQECYQRQQTPAATAVLPALFFVFLQRWARGELPYEYQDGVLDVALYQKMMNSSDALSQFVSSEMLFGSLAHSTEFHELMSNTVEKVENWLKSPQQPL